MRKLAFSMISTMILLGGANSISNNSQSTTTSSYLPSMVSTPSNLELNTHHKGVCIIGGGFAGITAAKRLSEAGVKVTLINSNEYFENKCALYTFACDSSYVNKNRKDFHELLKKVQVIPRSVKELDQNKIILEDGSFITTDYVVIATGGKYDTSIVQDPVNERVASLTEGFEIVNKKKNIELAQSFTVIGGGASGCELASELAESYPNKKIYLVSSSPLLSRQFPLAASQKAIEYFSKWKNVEIIKKRVTRVLSNGSVELGDHSLLPSEFSFLCTGFKPASQFLEKHMSHTLDEHKFVKVDEYLQVVGEERIFAVGDVSNADPNKYASTAEKQGVTVAKNIISQIKTNKFKKKYRPISEVNTCVVLGKSDSIKISGNDVKGGYGYNKLKRGFSLSVPSVLGDWD